jgi:hypothetical protein
VLRVYLFGSVAAWRRAGGAELHCGRPRAPDDDIRGEISAPKAAVSAEQCNGAGMTKNNEPDEPDVSITNRKAFQQTISDLRGLHEQLTGVQEQGSRLAASIASEAAKSATTTDSDVAPAFGSAMATLSEATAGAADRLPSAADSIAEVIRELDTFYRDVTGTDDAAAEDVVHT